MQLAKLSARHLLASAALLTLGTGIAQAELAYGLTDATPSTLFSFDTSNPTAVTNVAPVTGLNALHVIRGIDFRPNGGALYGISTNAAGSDAQVYTINLTTGVASAQGANFTLTDNTSTRVSMDFNPSVDRLRIVTGDTSTPLGSNFRWNPTTNAFVGADTALAYAPSQSFSGSPHIAGVAYSNNTHLSASTTLYAYDYSNDELVTIGNVGGTPVGPNSGQMFSVGSTGFFTGASALGFDISGMTGIGYLSVDDAPANDSLRTINLLTGATLSVGQFPGFVLDMSVTIPEPTTLGLLAGFGLIALRRR
ncbi:MAG TPA: DUF4394 domain-containing protein [Tepidisphaeraceae bacterium]|nr:DUF4394 domain-containing protein [Tepidisphaeraceae bacterium]